MLLKIRDHTLLRYRIIGTGPPIILVLGFGMTLDEWPSLMISRLAVSFRVILYNHRGISGDIHPEISFTIPIAAEDLHDVVTTLVKGPVHIAGYSMGGMIAMEFAIRYPDLVNRLILLNTHPGGAAMVRPEPWVMEEMGMEYQNPEDYLDRASRLLLTDTYRSEHPDPKSWFMDYGEPASPVAVRQQYRALLNWEGVFPDLEKITSQTFVIAGDRDIVNPAENARILAQAIPQATLEIIRGTGHGLIFERPVQIGEMMVQFLSDPTPAFPE